MLTARYTGDNLCSFPFEIVVLAIRILEETASCYSCYKRGEVKIMHAKDGGPETPVR
jgi:hypothetical protein